MSTKDDLLNRFTIVLRCNKNTMSLLERDTVKEVLSELFDKRIHLPNLYGSQRFGIQ
ncbi:tRNA pseudouridine(13) synthase TruD [Patescibacteria group bacterium]|nr:tRNA pseudouridine(13) synthase TruD [Patescibacteria group bacterium]